MLKKEELAFIKAISTLQLSPAILNELKMVCLEERRSQWCLQRSETPHLVVGPESLNDHRDCSRESVSPTRWQARASHCSPQTGAHRLKIWPRHCP
jgi:hypothetical protein